MQRKNRKEGASERRVKKAEKLRRKWNKFSIEKEVKRALKRKNSVE